MGKYHQNPSWDESQPDSLAPYLVKQEGGGRFYWFESTADIEKTVITLNRWSNGPWNPVNTEQEGGYYKYFSRDMPHAIQQLKYGWEDSLMDIDLTDAALAIPRDIMTEFERTQHTEGSSVDVGAYVQGLPECMYDFMPNIKRKKTVRIFMNMSADCAGNHKRLRERGTAIASCIDWLERSGYRVRIDVGDCFCGYGSSSTNGWCIAFCAKDYDQALDIERISYICGSPSMLNRIFFGIESTSKEMLKKFHGSYGGVAYFPKFLKDDYDYIVEHGAPFTSKVAEEIVKYIVSGEAPPDPPLIDTSGNEWRGFEEYDHTPPEDMDILILRPGKGNDILEEGEKGEGPAGKGDGGGGEPLFLKAKPSQFYQPYKYIVKDGPKTRAKAEKEAQDDTVS